MRMKSGNPKLKRSQIANQPGYSTSTLQTYRNDINMLSPNRINPNNTNKRTKKASNTSFDNNFDPNANVKTHRMTSNHLKMTSNEAVENIKN